MKAVIIALALLFVCGVAIAGDTEGAKNFSPPIFNDWLNHNHEYVDQYNDYERENPKGVGLDVVVYEAEGMLQNWGVDAIEVQQKYDFPNKEYSLFGVVKVNPYRLLRDMFK